MEAATLESGTAGNKAVVAGLESLTASFDSNLNTVVQKIITSNENFDGKINSLNQHLASVKNDIGAMKENLEG